MNADVILLGLGNPGSKYETTRHNIGFLLLDYVCSEASASFRPVKNLKAELAEVQWQGLKWLLIKPQTYMNLSGQSLNALYIKNSHLKKVPLIVAQDEVDLPMGRLRSKFGGGDAGHNGLKSIRACIGTGDYYRLRMGVGRPIKGSPVDVGDYVLQNFNNDELRRVEDMLKLSKNALPHLAQGDLAEAQKALTAK